MSDAEQSEKQPLLNEARGRIGRRHTSIVYEEARAKLIVKNDRTITVEPILALANVATAPFLQLYQEYVLNRTLQDLAEDDGINLTSSALSSKSNCLQSQNESGVNQTVSSITESSQATTAVFIMFLNIASAIPACIMTPFITAYSDKMGRRYAIVPPLVGLTCKTLIYLLTVVFRWPLWCLIIGSSLNGLTGDCVILTASCNAYVSDITTRDKRAVRMAVLASCGLIPLIVCPLLFGFMVKEVGYIYPFLCIFILQGIGLIYAIFFVPETIADLQSVPFWSWDQVKDIFIVFTREREPAGRRSQIGVLVLSSLTGFILVTGAIEVLALFQMNKPLCWDPQMIGIFLATFMAVAGLGQVVCVRAMKYYLPELIICLISTLSLGLQLTYLGFVRNTAMMFWGVLLAPVSMLALPMMRSMLSSLISPEEQGRLHGGLAFLERLGVLLSTVFFYTIYARTIQISSGFVFFVVAGLNMINALIILIFIIYLRVKKVDFRFLIVNRRKSRQEQTTTPTKVPVRVSFDDDC